jgi:hypothetical protein
MVLLAAGICNKNGELLVSRQFVEMSRSRVEGLFVTFSKLPKKGKQHTFLETETVRYVYQPMEELLLVLITTMKSNIFEDLETLRLFSIILPEYCDITKPTSVIDNAINLIFAFDESISLGYRENVDPVQIRTIMAKESLDEYVANKLEESKVKEAKAVMRQKALELEKKKKLGYDKLGASVSYSSYAFEGYEETSDVDSVGKTEPSFRSRSEKPVRKGWRLDKKKENDEFIGSLVAEGESLIAPLNKVASPSKDYGSCFFLQLLSLAFVQKSTAPHQLT